MTKKDFELIARILASPYCAEDQIAVRAVAYRFADALATTNPRFDRARFLAACGVQS